MSLKLSEIEVAVVPDFLNRNFFKKILESEYNNSEIIVLNVEVSNGSNDGENYFSKIFRAKISFNVETFGGKEMSFIVKYLPNEERRPFGENLNFFSKEIEMYNSIIPKINKLFEGKENLTPRFYFMSSEPARTLIFEDLKSLNYILADRQTGLDESQTLLVLEKIAKFHAASMVLAKKDPKLMKNFDKGFFHEKNRETTLQKNIFEGNLDCIANIVENWPNYEIIAGKLRKLKEIFMEKCLKIEETNDTELKVLNHGDLHLNNFMFKYKDDNPSDVIFIDLQMCHYASLGLDINYFLNSSVKIDVLKSKRLNLLDHYYIKFIETLNNLNYFPIPSWEDVLKEIHAKEFFGFFAFEGILPTISMHPDYCKKNNVDKYSGEEILKLRRKIMFSTERYIETMKYSLVRFNEIGVLE